LFHTGNCQLADYGGLMMHQNFFAKVCRKMRKRHWIILLFFVLVNIVDIQYLLAQTDLGSITGTVRDASSAVISNCNVEVKNGKTAAIRTAVTDQNGFYVVPSLAVGDYTVTVTAAGFQRTQATVTLTASGAAANFQLNVGNVEQQIVVSAEMGAVALQTDTHDLANSITPVQMENLPNSTGSILDIAVLGPASQPGTDVGVDGGDESFYGQTSSSVIISGLGNAHASFLQDGVANTNLMTETANILASVEATQEVTTMMNSAPARFSQPSVIDVITKSGSNKFHGTAYDNLQNDVFDATDWFATSKPAKRYNLFGGNASGPILKNKLFAFFDYSGLRSKTSSVTRTRVPTAKERIGNFSDDDTIIYDPSTYTATGTSTPFANNTLPSIDAFATLWLANYPEPNTTLGTDNVNYVKNLPSVSNYDKMLARGDYNLSDKDLIFGTMARYNGYAGSDSITPGLFGIYDSLKGTNVSASETHVFNATIVNAFKAGYNRSNLYRVQEGQSVKDYATYYGLTNVSSLAAQWAPPQINITDYASLGDPYSPQGAIQNRYQFTDEVSWKQGNHTITFGGEYIRTQFDGNWVIGNNGIYNFDGSATSLYTNGSRSDTAQGNAFADLELGYPRTANSATGTSLADFRGTDVSGYIQDDWKIFRKLTLNLGIRYDFDNPPNDRNGKGALFNVAKNENIKGTWNTNYRDWAPRIGFSYSVIPSIVVRGGYGIYYAPILYNNLQFELCYYPNFVNQSYVMSIAAPVDTQSLFVSNATLSQQSYSITEKLKDTSVQEWNLNVQRSLGSNTLLTIGYVGNETSHQSARADLNQPYALSSSNTNGILDLRHNTSAGTTDGQLNALSANYHGLVVKVDRTFTNGLQFTGGYTYSKAMDILDGDNADAQDLYNMHLTYGLAGFNRTHNAVISAVYSLPFGPGKLFLNKNSLLNKEVIGGWQLSGIQQFATGQPISITANNNADTSSVHSVFANRICSGEAPSGHTRLQFFNPACYAQPANGEYGTARSGPLQPGLDTTQLSLQKMFPIVGGHQVEFRASAFSVFNHPNLGAGSTTVTSSGAGYLTYETAGLRNLQLTLRYSF
jgi:hypothetical protein